MKNNEFDQKIAAIQEKITEHQQEIAKLQMEQQRLDSLAPDKRLADALHSKLCHWNHVDGCGWFYEAKDDWDRNSHQMYLIKARELIRKVPDVDVSDLICVVEALP